MKTRIFVGIAIILTMTGALTADLYFAPWYPFLLFVCLLGSFLASKELLHLVKQNQGVSNTVVTLAVSAILLSNWVPHCNLPYISSSWHSWQVTGSTALFFFFILTSIELLKYQAPGNSVNNLSLSAFILVYLGLLPSFLIQLRWIGSETNPFTGLLCLGLTISVTKCCDIGAYFTGKLIGRHLMTPKLSPKKTWEGFVGGILFSIIMTFLWLKIFPQTPLCCNLAAIGFGVLIGTGGVFADLVESLIKRDTETKDASHTIPGFGGILDLLDSLLLIGPIAWLFFQT